MNPEIIVINASPRKNGNCYHIIKDVVNILEENNISYEVFNLYDMNIEYCNACGFCEKKKGCRINDDMSPVYDKFNKSSGTIVVSPVYFDSIPAKMKTMIDRTQAVYSSKFVLQDSMINRSKKRIGMYIAVAGSEEYKTQFSGGDIVMDFFFRSINSRSAINMRISGTDKRPYKESDEFINDVRKNVNAYSLLINDIR